MSIPNQIRNYLIDLEIKNKIKISEKDPQFINDRNNISTLYDPELSAIDITKVDTPVYAHTIIMESYKKVSKRIIRDETERLDRIIKNEVYKVYVEEYIKEMERKLFIHYSVMNNLLRNNPDSKNKILKEIDSLKEFYKDINNSKKIISNKIESIYIFQEELEEIKEYYYKLIEESQNNDLTHQSSQKIESYLRKLARIKLSQYIFYSNEYNEEELIHIFLKEYNILMESNTSYDITTLEKIKHALILNKYIEEYLNPKDDNCSFEKMDLLRLQTTILNKNPILILKYFKKDKDLSTYYKLEIRIKKHLLNKKDYEDKYMLEIIKDEANTALKKFLLFSYFNCSRNIYSLFQSKISLDNIFSENEKKKFKDYFKVKYIIIKDKLSISTFIHLMYDYTKEEEYRQVINIYNSYIENCGYSKVSLLDGIEEIDFDRSTAGSSLYNLVFNTTNNKVEISNDVESFITDEKIAEKCSCLTFQDKVKIIKIPNIIFYNQSTIEVPSSIEALDINYIKGNINTLTYKEYKEDNKEFFEQLYFYYENLTKNLLMKYYALNDYLSYETNHSFLKEINYKTEEGTKTLLCNGYEIIYPNVNDNTAKRKTKNSKYN